MINNVTLVGRLTKDPELKYTQGGNAVTIFTIAANRPFKNAQGEQEADFINCVIWRKPAESLANYQRKGNLIGVTGSIQSRNYENNEGKRVYVTEVLANSVQFLEPKSSGQQNNQQQGNQNYQQPQNNQGNDAFSGQAIDINDDDLPF